MLPLGLPEPALPRFDLWKEMLFDSVAIGFVSYSVTVSMALIFGQKFKYDIDFNQELLAMVSFIYNRKKYAHKNVKVMLGPDI